jgi:chromosome segregation ATPase
VLAQGTRAVKPLDGESVSLVREAVLAQLAEQKRLRAWLRDQQHNYEYQVGEQRKQLDLQQTRITGLETSLEDESQGRTAERLAKEAEAHAHRETQQRFSAEVAALQKELSQTEQQRKHWEQRAGVLETEKVELQSQLAALKALHEGTVADWAVYADEMDRKLTEYRGQRAWRGMLALRKAYVLWARKGWRLRIIPWVWSVLRGGGGVESEQLEFPVRPKPRSK